VSAAGNAQPGVMKLQDALRSSELCFIGIPVEWTVSIALASLPLCFDARSKGSLENRIPAISCQAHPDI